MPSFLLHQKFFETAGRLPQKIALQIRESQTEYKRYTYGEALALSRALAFYFIRQGINKHDRVAMILENGPHWPIFYFGILFAGATAVPIDAQLTKQEIKNILADCGARLAINRLNAGEILKNASSPPQGLQLPVTDIEDPASIIYTSGTTAVPKGVVLTHKNFSSNFNGIDSLGICNENDNVISLLPLHHSYPFMITLLLPLALGGTVTYVKTLKPDDILSAMKETGVTLLVGVPQLFFLLHKGIFEKIDKLPPAIRILKPLVSKKVRAEFGAKLRFFVSGGARLDPKVAKDLSGLGFNVLEGYGLTETSPVVTFNPPGKQKFGSVGITLPGVEIDILGPAKDRAGEVLIKGPNVMKGYYKRDAETAEVMKGGWFHSGDLGYIDKDGYLFLTGRLKEIIVLGSGKNIYPDEIEAHYRKSPFIKELCVMGIFKEGAGEELGAVVVPDTGHFKLSGEINIREKIKWELENLSKSVSAYKRIISFVVAKEDLPKTRLGKIKRYEVENIYRGQFGVERTGSRGQGAEKEEDLEISNSEVGKKIADFIRENRGIKGVIRADDHLELDLGIDSLGRVELAAGLEKIFNINISTEDIAGIFTVKDAVLKVNEIISKKSATAVSPSGGADETIWQAVLKNDPKDKIKEKIDLAPGIADRIMVFIGTGFLHIVFKLIFALEVKGRENIPGSGPFILCPNHTSYLDGFVVAAAVPFGCVINLFFLGFREYFMRPVIRNMVKLMRVIPTDPAAELINAMQASSFVIRNNKSICIFPEGQRSIDGKLKEFKKGIGILSKESDAPLVPVYIEGAFEAWPRAEKFPKPHAIKVVFGRPLGVKYLVQCGRERGAKDDYEAIAAALREEVLKLR